MPTGSKNSPARAVCCSFKSKSIYACSSSTSPLLPSPAMLCSTSSSEKKRMSSLNSCPKNKTKRWKSMASLSLALRLYQTGCCNAVRHNRQSWFYLPNSLIFACLHYCQQWFLLRLQRLLLSYLFSVISERSSVFSLRNMLFSLFNCVETFCNFFKCYSGCCGHL